MVLILLVVVPNADRADTIVRMRRRACRKVRTRRNTLCYGPLYTLHRWSSAGLLLAARSPSLHNLQSELCSTRYLATVVRWHGATFSASLLKGFTEPEKRSCSREYFHITST